MKSADTWAGEFAIAAPVKTAGGLPDVDDAEMVGRDPVPVLEPVADEAGAEAPELVGEEAPELEGAAPPAGQDWKALIAWERESEIPLES
jgi:hypothetical protein